MIRLILGVVVLGALELPLFAQDRIVKERLRITLEFGRAFQHGILSNEAIMKTYVAAEGYYFKNEEVKKLGNEFLNLWRELKDCEMQAFKYSEYENEFLVDGVRSLGDTSMNPHKLRFILSVAGPDAEKEHVVNTDDLYIIKTKNENGDEGSFFILLDDKNKIRSFATWAMGDVSVLMQF